MKRYKRFFIVSFMILILFVMMNAPLPYDVIQPGTVRALENVVEVKNKESSGGLHMVTAKINPATPFNILFSWSDPYARIIPKVKSDEEEEKRNMIESRKAAEVIAFQITKETSQLVHYVLEDVGGPSAGFMMALEMIQQITGDPNNQGKKIAGTGTIGPLGEVGKIGAIQFKIVAADRENMDLFFYPADNEEEVYSFLKTYETNMKLVPIQTIYDALEYLRREGNA